ncbi:MAG: ROK family protein [Bacilli bacterium]
MRRFLAIDIGGTSIKYGIVTEKAEVIHSDEVATNATGTPDYYIGNFITYITPYIERFQPDGIAISTAGQVCIHSGKIMYAGQTLPYYTDFALKKRFEEKFHLPVSVENDVNCALLGEMWQGNLPEDDCMMLTIGTGIGGALRMNGELYRGKHFAAGEWGYMLVDGEMYETVASTSALVRKVARVLDCDERTISGKKIMDMLQHPAVACTFDAWVTAFVKGLCNLIYVLDIPTIIVGGGISQNREFQEYLQIRLQMILPKHIAKRITIRTASLGNKAGFIGAVHHFLQSENKEKRRV